jgi:hypothetical protein
MGSELWDPSLACDNFLYEELKGALTRARLAGRPQWA